MPDIARLVRSLVILRVPVIAETAPVMLLGVYTGDSQLRIIRSVFA